MADRSKSSQGQGSNQGQGAGARRSHEQGGQSHTGGERPAMGPSGGQSWEAMGGRLGPRYESAREQVGRRYRRVEGTIARNPASSVLIGFGLGVGVGALLGLALTRRESSWSPRYLGESMRDLPDRMRHLASRVPQSIRQGMHALPESVSQYLPHG